MNITIYTDGGARGNPGPAAVGAVIEMSNDKFPMTNEKTKIIEISKRIGETTNNVAEYTAVLEALKEVKNQEGEKIKIQFFLDSLLVVNQLNGLFKIKDARLRELATQVRILEQEVGGVITYAAIRREQNSHADILVNRALDGG